MIKFFLVLFMNNDAFGWLSFSEDMVDDGYSPENEYFYYLEK